jgi:hypothetical protein
MNLYTDTSIAGYPKPPYPFGQKVNIFLAIYSAEQQNIWPSNAKNASPKKITLFLILLEKLNDTGFTMVDGQHLQNSGMCNIYW